MNGFICHLTHLRMDCIIKDLTCLIHNSSFIKSFELPLYSLEWVMIKDASVKMFSYTWNIKAKANWIKLELNGSCKLIMSRDKLSSRKTGSSGQGMIFLCSTPSVFASYSTGFLLWPEGHCQKFNDHTFISVEIQPKNVSAFNPEIPNKYPKIILIHLA